MDKLDDILGQTSALRPPRNLGPPPVSQRDWEEAVGSRVARRTQPLRLERGVLYVRVANAAWSNELSLLADDILAQLTRRGLAVEALRFSVGPISRAQATRHHGPPKQAPPPDAELPPELKEQVGAIANPELKDAIAGAAAKLLALREDED